MLEKEIECNTIGSETAVGMHITTNHIGESIYCVCLILDFVWVLNFFTRHIVKHF